MTNSNADIDAALNRSPELLSAGRSQLLIVDVQEKLIPVINGGENVTASCSYLIQAAQMLGVPVFVSEQYPKGLGSTVPELSSSASDRVVFEKMRFSAAEGLAEVTSPAERNQIVIAGIEAHICVLQTALDLLAVGYRVYVASDGVGSRNTDSVSVALNRIRDSGGVVLPCESVAFEWCEVAGTDEFRDISRLTRERSSA